MKNKKLSKYERAQKRVSDIKGFYNHLAIYIVINALLLIFKDRVSVTIISERAMGNPEFMNWLDWNVYGTPIIWGIALVIHASCVFGNISLFGKRWQERQIQKYMDVDKKDTER